MVEKIMNDTPKVLYLRKQTGLSQAAFSKEYGIPIRTIQSWELGERKPPEYVINLLEKVISYKVNETTI